MDTRLPVPADLNSSVSRFADSPNVAIPFVRAAGAVLTGFGGVW